MINVQEQYAQLESRLSLAERQIKSLTNQLKLIDFKKSDLGNVAYKPDDPRIAFSLAYTIETDSEGKKFTWVGGKNGMQILFPHRSLMEQDCEIILYFHRKVDVTNLEIYANEIPVDHNIEAVGTDQEKLTAKIPPSFSQFLNLSFVNITGVRPSDLGEGADDRLLIARFYHATFRSSISDGSQ